MSRVWFITGCSTGFGKSLAEEVLAKGNRAVITARDQTSLQSLAEQYPKTCLPLSLDITNSAQITTTVQEAVSRFGQIDVLVNNAGYGLIGAIEEYSEEQIERNLRTNLIGPLNLLRAVLPGMRSQRQGHIINMSAVAGVANHEGFSVYGGAKFGLEGASEALKIELAPFGIHVILVEPGPFRTDFINRSMDRGVNPISEYDGTSGKFRKLLESLNGKQPGDPVKAGKVIVQLVDEAKPPFRLPLGAFAYRRIRQKIKEQIAELDTWEPVGKNTDFTS